MMVYSGILISYYRQRKYLEKILPAYLDQKGRDIRYELVICNDDEEFDSYDILEKYRSLGLKVKVVNNPKKEGYQLAKMWNAGAKTLCSSPPLRPFVRLVFTNADLFPSSYFVYNHSKANIDNVLGGYIHRIPLNISNKLLSLSNDLTEEDFIKHIKEDRVMREWNSYWASEGPIVFDKIRGGNFSISGKYFFEENGFDENFPHYGGEESDLLMRLYEKYDNLEFKISDLARNYHFDHDEKNKQAGEALGKAYLFAKHKGSQEAWMKKVLEHANKISKKYKLPSHSY